MGITAFHYLSLSLGVLGLVIHVFVEILVQLVVFLHLFCGHLGNNLSGNIRDVELFSTNINSWNVIISITVIFHDPNILFLVLKVIASKLGCKDCSIPIHIVLTLFHITIITSVITVTIITWNHYASCPFLFVGLLMPQQQAGNLIIRSLVKSIILLHKPHTWPHGSNCILSSICYSTLCDPCWHFLFDLFLLLFFSKCDVDLLVFHPEAPTSTGFSTPLAIIHVSTLWSILLLPNSIAHDVHWIWLQHLRRESDILNYPQQLIQLLHLVIEFSQQQPAVFLWHS